MSASAPVPRPDQIAELTRGLDLPLPAISEDIMAVIVEGLFAAFAAIRIAAPQVIADGDEAEVTALFEARLNAMIEEDPLWRQLVASVARGKESLNFDGVHLEKRPDLSLHLTAQSRRFPLIAEAKIIDASKGEALYCTHGVRRFLDGDYAWGGREALMIAYVRDGSTIANRLAPYLAKPDHSHAYAVEATVAAVKSAEPDVACTRHARSFLYSHVAAPANMPGPIALWHMWFDASTAVGS